MNIALITNEFYPKGGGIAYALTSICKSFQNKEHNLYVFNPYHKGPAIFDIFEKPNYSFEEVFILLKKRKFLFCLFYIIWKIIRDKRAPFSHRLNMVIYLLIKPNILINTINNYLSIYPHLKKLKIDLIFGGSGGSFILPLIYILSRGLNKKSVIYAHGNEFLVHSKLSLKTYYLKRLDKVILTNQRMKYLIEKVHHLEEKMLTVIHLGLFFRDYEEKKTKQELRRKFNISDDCFVIISVGRHVPRKNFNLVIKAISEIKKLKPSLNLKYYLIGEGLLTEEYKKLTRTLNISDYVEFLGFCDSKKRNMFFKLSDLFIMPSIKKKESIEGFGIVFLEANYYKIPVIGTKIGGIVEAIKDRETGLLIESNNLTDLINKILYLIDNNEKRIIMGKKGYERVINEFDAEKIYYNYVNLFKEILKD